MSSKVTPEGGEDTPAALTEGQINVSTSKFAKRMMVTAILLGCFFDTLGTVLMVPAGPILVQNAQGGPIQSVTESQFDALEASGATRPCPKGDYPCIKASPQFAANQVAYGNPRAFKDVPAGFSLANNLVMLAIQVGSGVGASVFGSLSDLMGSKPVLLICMGATCVGYVFVFLSGMFGGSYWLYFLSMLWSGFFSVSMPISQAFFGKVFDEKEAEPYMAIVVSMAVLGGGMGALILMPFVSGDGGNVFYSCFVALAGALIATVMISIFVHEPKKMSFRAALKKQTSMKKSDTVAVSSTSKTAATTLTLLVIGSTLDSAGDEGTRIARGTIMQVLYPNTSSIDLQNLFILGTLGVVFLAMAISGAINKLPGGFANSLVVGATATLIGQLCFLIPAVNNAGEGQFGLMLLVFYIAKTFGFMSNLGVAFSMNQVAPPDAKGTWNGRNELCSKMGGSAMTLIMAVLYDELSKPPMNDKVGQTAIIICACVSFLAVCTYLPTYKLLPTPEKPLPKDYDFDALKSVPDEEFALLPAHVRKEVNFKLIQDGGKERVLGWGKYEEDIKTVENLLTNAYDELKVARTFVTKTLLDKKQLQMCKAYMMEKRKTMATDPQTQTARQEMGQWFADYLDDAGYDGWETNPMMYKAMLLNAFPPIDAIDAKKVDLEQSDAEFEQYFMRILKTQDQHIAAAENRRSAEAGAALRRFNVKGLFRF